MHCCEEPEADPCPECDGKPDEAGGDGCDTCWGDGWVAR